MDPDQKTECHKLIVEAAGLELKGKNNLYTSHNGHMFSFYGKGEVVALRFDKVEQEKFIADNDSDYVIQYGSTMRGYVSIPDTILNDTDKAAKLWKRSLNYIKTLPPK